MEKCVLSDLSIWLVCCLVLCFGGSAESSGEIAREVELTSPTSHYTIVTTKLSWNDAQGACARTSSHLVYVNSTEESEYLKQAVSRYELPLKDYWIGLVRDDVNWTWQDGTGLGYTNWREVGTSSSGGESDEDRECVTINMSTQQWKTKECHKKNYYICEREIVCPDGFELFESSCYHLISETQTDGVNARNACANVYPGSHLAFIESQSEQTFLVELITAMDSEVGFWFGLTFTSDAEHPEWLDGRPLGDFTAWDKYGVFDEKSPCVRLRKGSNFLWNDRPCTNTFGCVCEIEIEGNQTVLTPTPAVTAEPAPSLETKEAVYKASPSDMAAPMDRHHVQSMSALSLFRCATYCLRHNNCASFNYKSAEGKAKLDSFCELYSMQFSDEELTEKRGYRHYRV